MLFGRITDTVQALIRTELSTAEVAVDATMGNGNDTLFLSEFVGTSGRVYAFDVQRSAIETTEKLLQSHKAGPVQLIHDGHENMARYIDRSVDLIMFNLGYLPKADQRVITKPETTVRAITTGLDLLKSKGLMTIVSYYGHPGGDQEKEALQSLLKNLDQKRYHVVELSAYNRKNDPPITYFVRKK